MTISKEQFKANANRLSENLTVAVMAKAIAQSCRNKALESDILSMVGSRKDKQMDFSRSANLLSMAVYNKDWNALSAEFKSQEERQHVLTKNVLSASEVANLSAPQGQADDPFNKYNAEEFHQQLFASLEYEGVTVESTGGIEHYTDSNGLLCINENIFFSDHQNPDADTKSGFFETSFNTETGEFVSWCSACYGVDDIIGESSELNKRVGKHYKGLIEKTLVSAFMVKDHGGLDPINRFELITTLDVDSVDDFFDSIEGPHLRHYQAYTVEHFKSTFAWDCKRDKPFVIENANGSKKHIFKI